MKQKDTHARSSCQFSSIRRNLRRGKISPPIRDLSTRTWPNSPWLEAIWFSRLHKRKSCPPGFTTLISLGGPAAAGLEDRFRPAHFAGVATIVAKLLNQCRPDVAIFGEKDYQQLKVVTQMARDLDFETKILAAPTLRENDGLALSCRIIYLSAKERAVAPSLYAALRRGARDITEGVTIEIALDAARKTVAAAGFVTDYFEARQAETLAPVTSRDEGPIRLLAAAKLGKTRRIDNIGL
jgi:pantoate--beta-alanine ligase